MPHFVISCDGEYPSASIDKGPDLDIPSWFHGRKVSEDLPLPLEYTIDPERPGILCAMYDDMAYPLMREDLIRALDAAGVDNIQYFPAVIRDPTNGLTHNNYKAFNIVGTVAAANLAASELMPTSDSTLIDVDFASLSLDSAKAASFRVFRLAESVSAIIVDDVVRAEIEARDIPGMVFYDPADWSG